MKLTGKVVVVTGGGNGIGRALCRRFAAEGAKAVVVADMNGAAARQVADEIGGTAIAADVSREADVVALVARTIARTARSICSARTPASPSTATSTRPTPSGRAAGTST